MYSCAHFLFEFPTSQNVNNLHFPAEKRSRLAPRSNPAVERDSQKAALFGSLRASRSGCPSLPRWASV